MREVMGHVDGRPDWRRRVRLAALIILGLAAMAHGAEYSVDPSLGVRTEYNDNILLTVLPHRDVYGVWVSPAVALKVETEQLKVESTMQVDFVRYYGQEGLDITNFFFPLSSSYQTERHRFGLNGTVTRENTLVGELQQTGVVNRRTQRNTRTANPSWMYGLTEHLTLQTDYSFSDVTYTDSARFGLFDYQLHSGSAGLSYKLTERDDASFSAYYVNFVAPTLGFRSVFPGAQGALTHKFSESLEASLHGGVRFATASVPVFGGGKQTDRDTIFLFGADLVKRWDTMTVTAGVSRDIFPSGAGLLVQTDHYSASWSWNLTNRLTASVSGNAYQISAIAQAQALPNSLYLVVEPKLHWRWSEWWSTDLTYHYARLEIDVNDLKASQNAVFATATFHWPAKLARSR